MNTHEVENNQESQTHLNENTEHFSKQCERVLCLLKSGVRLTSRSAMINYGIGHLPRRLKDLRDFHGVKIEEEWELDDDGKTTRNKVWFITIPKPPTKKDLQEWFRSYQEEGFEREGRLVQTSLF